jgi:outer membrane protein assembly factor BamB
MVAALLALCLAPPSHGAKPKPEPKEKGSQTGPPIFQTDKALIERLAIAREIIQEDNGEDKWEAAIPILQLVLDARKNGMVKLKKPSDDKEIAIWRNARLEAERLLGTFPAKALLSSESSIRADALLRKARRQRDGSLYAELVRRFWYTEAGKEALRLLANLNASRGDYFKATLQFDRWLRTPGLQHDAASLYRAALAFRKVGDRDKAEMAWKRFKTVAGPKGFRLGIRALTLAQLLKDLEKDAPLKPASQEWPMFGGNLRRSALCSGGMPVFKLHWQWSIVNDPLEEKEYQKHPLTSKWVKTALERQQKLRQAILPGFFPTAVGGMIVYRTYNGIAAAWVKKGVDEAGVKHEAGELAWKSDSSGGLTNLLAERVHRITLTQWLSLYRSSFSNVVHENSMVGTLSSYQGVVFAVDDLAIPPHPRWMNLWDGWPPKEVGFGGMEGLVTTNSLQAYDLESGKLLWELPNRNDPADFAESHFLGAPLGVGGKLYALNEKWDDLRLVCLDPAKGKVLYQKVLCTVRAPFARSLLRRTNAVHLAYDDGVLVIPTHAGAILGLDILTNELLWAYTYPARKPDPKAKPGAQPPPGWSMATPVIADRKVVFTAPDTDNIHCLDLHDGSPLWQAGRKKDVYMAGAVGGKVLLVSPTTCRALNLKDGELLWEAKTGMPSGRGVTADGLYYLPLASKEIVAIDLDKGRILKRFKVPKGQPAPGNIFFHDGFLVSQTATDVTLYPVIADKKKLTVNKKK